MALLVPFKRILRGATIAVSTACLTVTLLPLNFASADEVEPEISNSFSAGSAAVEVAIPKGNSLAGYFPRRRIWSRPQPNAHYFLGSTGQHDPIRAKSVVLKTKDRTFVFVSLDLVGIFPQFRDEVLQRLIPYGIRSEDLLIAATHTHSAPGGFAKVSLWEQLATDKFNPVMFKNIVDAIASSISKAIADMHTAKIGIAQAELKDVSFNRRNAKTHEPTLTLVKIETESDAPIATIFNFPVHGTILDSSNLQITADLPGAIERGFEADGKGVTLFMSEAAGDIAPKIKAWDFNNVKSLSEEIVKQAKSIYEKIDTDDELEIQTKQTSVKLPDARLSLRKCISIFGSLGEYFYNSVLPPDFNKPMVLRSIRLNSHVFMSVPAEPIAELGHEAKKYMKTSGVESVSIIALADSYMGYILTAAEYKRGGYESCNSFYGSEYGTLFLKGAKALSEVVAE